MAWSALSGYPQAECLGCRDDPSDTREAARPEAAAPIATPPKKPVRSLLAQIQSRPASPTQPPSASQTARRTR
jgi:hypothetical protein